VNTGRCRLHPDLRTRHRTSLLRPDASPTARVPHWRLRLATRSASPP